MTCNCDLNFLKKYLKYLLTRRANGSSFAENYEIKNVVERKVFYQQRIRALFLNRKVSYLKDKRNKRSQYRQAPGDKNRQLGNLLSQGVVKQV